MEKIIIIALLFASMQGLVAQSVGVGTNTPNPSAQLDINSISKGALIPRMTTAQRKAILNPEPGLMVFDTDKRTIFMYQSPQWGQLNFKNSEQGELMARTAADGEVNNYLGQSVSISGDYVIAGTYQADIGSGSNQGAAYIFHRVNGNWLEEAKLTASDGANEDYFGTSVSINGNYAIVGASSKDNVAVDQGAAYIFFRTDTTWTQQAKIIAPDGGANDQFGKSVSISGSYVIIGCWLDDIGSNTNQGSAYIFSRAGTTWSLTKKLTASDGAANDLFGGSVSINGIYAIVGSNEDDIGTNTNQGSAYIFSAGAVPAWGQLQKLTDSDGDANDDFGKEVCVNGDYAGITSTKAAFIFTKTSVGVWVEQDQKTGYQHINISGDYAVISQEGDNTIAGRASVFKRTGTNWISIRTLTDIDPTITSMYPNYFASSAGIDGYNIVIGAVGKYNFRGELQFINIE